MTVKHVKTYKVDPSQYPDEYRDMLKPEMTKEEISKLGQFIFKKKVEKVSLKFKKIIPKRKVDK